MSRPTTPKKTRKSRKKVISSRWVVPPLEQSEKKVDRNGSSSPKTFRACRCQPASPNSQVSSPCQCMQRKEQQGTMARPTEKTMQMNGRNAFATRPLDISASSSEATTDSLYGAQSEQFQSKPGQPDASEDETEFETKTKTEPTMEKSWAQKFKMTNKPLPFQGKRSGNTPKLKRNRADPMTRNQQRDLFFTPRYKNEKSKKQDEEVTETRDDKPATRNELMKTGDLDDEDLTEEDKEMIRLRGKATLMKLCMESCTRPIYKKKGETYNGKYSDINEIIAEWKSEKPEMDGEGSIPPDLDDQMSSVDNEPVLEKSVIQKRSARSAGGKEGPEGGKYLEKDNCRTCTPQERILRQIQLEKDNPHREFLQAASTRGMKYTNRKTPAGTTVQEPTHQSGKKMNAETPITGRINSRTPTNGSAALRNSTISQEQKRVIDEEKEERWCEKKCKEIAWGTEIDESQAKDTLMAMGQYDKLSDSLEQDLEGGQQEIIQEPVMASAPRVGINEAQNEEEVDEEYELWCDKTCETIARLPEMWTAPDPAGIIVRVLEKGEKYVPLGSEAQEEPQFASSRNKYLAKTLGEWHRSEAGQQTANHEMTEEQKEYKIQKMAEMCRQVCLDQPKKIKRGGQALSEQKGGNTPRMRAMRKAMQEKLELEETEKKENEMKEHEMNKMRMRQNLTNVCMERCNKVMNEGTGGGFQGVGQENRQQPQLVTEPLVASEHRRGYLPLGTTTGAAPEASQLTPADYCEGMRSICEKLADELVEQHYKYGPPQPGYHLNGGWNTTGADEPKFESSNRRQPQTTLNRTGSEVKLKEDSEPKFKTVKQNLKVLRTKISRGSVEEPAAQKARLEELSSSSRLKVGRKPQPKREPGPAQSMRRTNRRAKDRSDTSVVSSPPEDPREEFYQALDEIEEKRQPERHEHSPTIVPQPNNREQTSPYKSPPIYLERLSPVKNPSDDHVQATTIKQPPVQVSTYTQTEQPKELTLTHEQPSYYREETSTYKEYRKKIVPRANHDSSAQTGPRLGRNTQAYAPGGRSMDITESKMSLSVTSATSSRVMFADKPITTPPDKMSPPSGQSLLSRCGSNESCNTCGHAKSHPKRGCLKCPVSSGRRTASKNIYLKEEELTKLRDSASRSRLKGMQTEGIYNFSHRLSNLSDITIERSYHSLTICAQADARRRLIERNMIEFLGLQGIEPIVVEKTIGGCTWGVRAYKI